jgi:hypothetical protein
MRRWGLGWCFWLAACGGGGAAIHGSCDLTGLQTGGYCQDYAKVPAIGPYKDSCTQGGGVWSDKACTRANALGGCTDPQGATINWFYVGGVYASKADYQTVCEMSSGIFVDP